MASQQKNTQQIVRKDGNSCFVGVMNTSFEIEKVLFNFYTYDTSAQAGSRLKNGINIYMSFDEFYRICHDITISKALINEVLKMAQDAKAAGKTYAPQKIIHQGGRSAASLNASGQGRPDNMSLARQLKIQAGSKYPILLIAESGPGEQDAKGLIVPRYQQPECKVTIPFTHESLKELFLTTKAHVDAFIAAQYTYRMFHPEENPQKQQYQKGNGQNYNNSSSAPTTVAASAPPPPPPPVAQQQYQYQNTNNNRQNYNGQRNASYQQNANRGDGNQQQRSRYGRSQTPPPPPPDAFDEAPPNISYGNSNQYAPPPPPPPDPYASRQQPTPPPIQAQTPPPANGYGDSQNFDMAPQFTDEEYAFWAAST